MCEVAGFQLTDEVLGKGRYSKVVKAKHLRTGEEVACKIITKKEGKWRDQTLPSGMAKLGATTQSCSLHI